MNKITIEIKTNGYIVSSTDSEDSFVFLNNRDELVACLYYISELLGESYDKFAKDNLRIDFKKKGHKYEK